MFKEDQRLTVPDSIMRQLEPFRPVFSDRVWGWAQELLLGALLAPGRRTVTRILRVIGLGQETQFQDYHRVLNRAAWSGLALSQQLLLVLVSTLVPAGATVVLGADETLERRRGAHIAELRCYRDAARSTARNKVKSMGLRWLSLMLIVPLPWATRPWALPFLTVSAPGAAVDAAQKRRHKTSVDWLRQMVLQVVRWLPGRRIVLVVDGGLAAVGLEHCCQSPRVPVTYVTRLRLDARLFDPAPVRQPGTRGRTRVAGARQPKAAERLDDPLTVWQTARLPWADGKMHPVEWVSDTALWYVSCKPTLPGRWVLVRGAQLNPCLLFCTDPEASPPANHRLVWATLERRGHL
ncbi:MAG TPA: transposase [Candidatus Limnocylindrales bacterium]|nr:transposase [Candidatus Limnocylindrales bacterium]